MDFDIERVADKAVTEFGSPLYLYFPEKIEQRIALLREACPEMGIRYAVKSNPNPWLLRWFRDRIESLDVSSSGELELAQKNGWSGSELEFTGPAKTRADLEFALDSGVGSIVVEDISEVRLLNEICESTGREAHVLVRIAPKLPEKNFAVRLAGRVTQFGVDEERLPEFFDEVKQLNRISITGFHIYSGSQCLDDEAMAEHFRSMWALFKRTIETLGAPVSELVFGAGMGIPYHDGDSSLNLDALRPVSREILAEIKKLGYPVKTFIEVGRFLVGEAGYFVTRVVRVKQSLGTRVVICDGGMNHNLGACGHLGGMSHRHYQMQLVSRQSKSSNTELQLCRVVGPLCTAIDTLALNISLPEVCENDLIVVACSGSYGPSSSPLYFISHRFPSEVAYFSASDSYEDISWLKPDA